MNGSDTRLRAALAALAIALNVPITRASADETRARIASLETEVAQLRGEFSYKLHNDLRHLYSGVDEKRSLHHCDVIFRHSPMNAYILAILSGWKLESDRVKAIENLRGYHTRFPEFRFVAAATLIKAGDLSLEEEDRDGAERSYRQAASMTDPDLKGYTAIARARLGSLDGKIGGGPWTIRVLDLRYFPLARDGKTIDITVTSNVGDPLDTVRARCDQLTRQVARTLEEGSRFRPYRNPDAKPSLKYEIVDTLEVLEAMPANPKKPKSPDYINILERAGITEYVEKNGVKEVWLWGYHSPELSPWESNMASPHGDISNSDRDPADLPVLGSTYTVYHYNYQRGPSEATEDHMHQIEALMRDYGGELFKAFEGERGRWRCGNCHFPPNGQSDYDWANKSFVMTDIEDWRPEGHGEMKSMNCERWGCDSLRWFTFWMQSLPGADNDLSYRRYLCGPHPRHDAGRPRYT